ncbi:hypothetical protein VitviT2T_021903 [Vitis vinifera]|uniref:Uncharacterized protein n=1 Tax=Vitis vinifera TaxID=29760 RepID=A0ABY9D8D5_VITVI|nr:hypothetical protein VitviT2T_021903 [Vitis vinifera]
MKAKYYNPYNTDEERLCHRPPHLSEDDWRWLIHFWGTPEAKDISEKNKTNRAEQVIKHTSGSKSYAQIRYEQAQKKEDQSEPNRIEMFALTHTRKDGTPVDDHSKEIMDQFQQLLSQPEGTSSSTSASSGASTLMSSYYVIMSFQFENKLLACQTSSVSQEQSDTALSGDEQQIELVLIAFGGMKVLNHDCMQGLHVYYSLGDYTGSSVGPS